MTILGSSPRHYRRTAGESEDLMRSFSFLKNITARPVSSIVQADAFRYHGVYRTINRKGRWTRYLNTP